MSTANDKKRSLDEAHRLFDELAELYPDVRRLNSGGSIFGDFSGGITHTVAMNIAGTRKVLRALLT